MRVIGSVVAGDGDEGGEDDVKKREIMAEKDLREEKKLAIMMLTGRRRKLYDRIMKNKNKKARRVRFVMLDICCTVYMLCVCLSVGKATSYEKKRLRGKENDCI